ncbi:hypothetical protein JTF08_13530 [Micrococcaceae bacterium RIT802]|nr:hypothetical protein [Micrococcaceae bacterium RIT 802]
MELQVASGRRRLTRAELLGSQDILEEDGGEPDEVDEFDAEMGFDFGGTDPEITDAASEALADRVYEELLFRQRALGELYPFQVVAQFNSWHLTRRPSAGRREALAHMCYLTCLLMTAARSELLKDHLGDDLKREMADAFQAVAYINAAELVGGRAYWMGWPRPDSRQMLDAVKDLVTVSGLGVAVEKRPPGVNEYVKDGGIDIVAWRSFLDGRPPGLVLLGQVASGANWEAKPINGNKRRYDPFFTRGQSSQSIHALFIPRVGHDTISEDTTYAFDESAINAAYNLEGDMGLIIDRLRLTELSAAHASASRYETGEFGRCARMALRWFSKALKVAQE